jgi:hypothetical protein
MFIGGMSVILWGLANPPLGYPDDQFRLTEEYLNPTVNALLELTETQSYFDTQDLTRAASTPSPTITGTPPTRAPCYFNWATQDLPELTAEVQAAMDEVGLENVTAGAYAYGENCYAYDSNEVVYFATMETDFRVNAQVDDLADTEALGDLTADILAVLNEFPPDETPGPMAGQITLTFVKGDEQVALLVSVEVAAQVVEQGIRGGGLWVVLNEVR